MNKIKGLRINEAIYNLPNGQKGKIAVLIYSGESDPAKTLDYAVSIYVQNSGYFELIAANLDDPCTRVILSEINSMNQEDFDIDKHRLDNSI